MKRRVVLQAAASTIFPVGIAHAQSSSTKPVEWVVPYPAGGPVDANARKLAELVAPRVGQPIVIQNRPGANGTLGASHVMRAAPDGLTFGVCVTETLVTVSSLLKSPPYDGRKDLALIAMVTKGLPVLMTNRESGIRSMGDLVQAAKAKPDSIAYGSWGMGSLAHLALACVERSAGIKLVHVPYKGVAPMTADMLGNTVQLSVGSVGSARPFMEKGQVTVLAVMGTERSPFLPQVPTLSELGFGEPFLLQSTRQAVFAPRGLPVDVADRWAKSIAAAVKQPEYEAFAAAVGSQIAFSGPAEATIELATEWKVTNDLIRSLGIPAA